MRLGIDKLISNEDARKELEGRKLALLANPASITGAFVHSVDAIMATRGLKLSAAFGPQHGMRGDKQDNMIESEDYRDPMHGIPVYSLYGKVRRPTPDMLSSFDVMLVDIQDVGCRIYTFLTTLLYILEGAARTGKSVWVLDRPNPAGRPVEGLSLRPGWESFVGAGPIPMRHGLTLGEAARWFVSHYRLDVDLKVITMDGYEPSKGPGYGWPLGEFAWVNPSPNAATPSMPRCYSGTVLIEGTLFSEGRGTTRPLEAVGAPDLNMREILAWMNKTAPHWLRGCKIRPCFFEPTFNKHAGKMCSGIQLHVDDPSYSHDEFKPYRLIALWLKAIKRVHPEKGLWRSFHYEYEAERLAIDIINGGTELREWVEDQSATPSDFDAKLEADEKAWIEERQEFLLY
jgi:uncharacterized protein YbbC (DUF1343 family)